MTSRINTNIRYYLPGDPYYYEVDNLPLEDLAANDVSLQSQIDELKARVNLKNNNRKGFSELRPYLDKNKPGKVLVEAGNFLARLEIEADFEAFNPEQEGLTSGKNPCPPSGCEIDIKEWETHIGGGGGTLEWRYVCRCKMTEEYGKMCRLKRVTINPDHPNKKSVYDPETDGKLWWKGDREGFRDGVKACDTPYPEEVESSRPSSEGRLSVVEYAGDDFIEIDSFADSDFKDSKSPEFRYDLICIEAYPALDQDNKTAKRLNHDSKTARLSVLKGSGAGLKGLVVPSPDAITNATNGVFTLPVAYIKVPHNYVKGDPLQARNIIDVRPFFKSSEFTSDERQAVANATAPSKDNRFLTANDPEFLEFKNRTIEGVGTQSPGNHEGRILNLEKKLRDPSIQTSPPQNLNILRYVPNLDVPVLQADWTSYILKSVRQMRTKINDTTYLLFSQFEMDFSDTEGGGREQLRKQRLDPSRVPLPTGYYYIDLARLGYAPGTANSITFLPSIEFYNGTDVQFFDFARSDSPFYMVLRAGVQNSTMSGSRNLFTWRNKRVVRGGCFGKITLIGVSNQTSFRDEGNPTGHGTLIY